VFAPTRKRAQKRGAEEMKRATQDFGRSRPEVETCACFRSSAPFLPLQSEILSSVRRPCRDPVLEIESKHLLCPVGEEKQQRCDSIELLSKSNPPRFYQFLLLIYPRTTAKTPSNSKTSNQRHEFGSKGRESQSQSLGEYILLHLSTLAATPPPSSFPFLLRVDSLDGLSFLSLTLE